MDLGFPAAAAGLADLARGGLLTGVSQTAYGDGLARVGPLDETPGMSTLVQVYVLDVVTRGEAAVLALRWQATGPGGKLFPALDADIWLTPGWDHSARLSLAGSTGPARRPGRGPRQGGLSPGGRRDDTVPAGPHRGRSDASPGPGWHRAGNRDRRGRRPPGRARNALARRPAGGRIRLPVIEYDVPDVPDRQVQLAEGFADLASSPAMAVDQPQGRFQGQSRREDPVDHDIVQGPGDAVAILHQAQDHLRRVACPAGRGVVGRPDRRFIGFRYRTVAGRG